LLERALMGSVISGDALPSQLELEEKDFGDPLCRRLFALCRRMEAQRQAVDLTGVCMADESLDAGSVVEIAQERCVSAVLLQQHSAQLRNKALRRRLSALMAGAQERLCGEDDPRETVERLKMDMAIELAETTGNMAGREMILLILDVLEQFGKTRENAEPISTGIGRLDRNLIGGFRPGDLVVVAALTSVGKSAMLSFMMRNAAAQGKRILLVSCEMSEEQNAERYLSAMSGVSLGKIVRREALSDEENLRISDGMELYHPENIRVISSGTQTAASIRREALRMKQGAGLDMIVVDYLQRLRPDKRLSSKADEVGSIASALKSMAVDLGVPVLTAAQFNREAAKNRSEAKGNETQGVPALHQLRDSSQIEDEANTVIVLDEPARRPTGCRDINAHVVKNRSGELGSVRLKFDADTMTYREADGMVA